ncbi:MAG TPA: hypothetical protein VFI11_07445 [Anaerolineales bacterium]|nr:hypothetical protein [Anaerolineales bacterium]
MTRPAWLRFTGVRRLVALREGKWPVQVLRAGMTAVILAALGAVQAAAESLTIDFERLPDGSLTSQSMLITNEFLDRFGVRFPDGVEVVGCPGAACEAAHSGERAIQPLLENEFTSKPFEIRFDTPASAASLYISHSAFYDEGRTIEVELQAFDSSSRQVGRDTASFTNDGAWHRLEVDVGEASIVRLRVSGGATIYPDDSNFLVLDDLQFELPAAPTPLPPDNQPPQVTFLAPAEGAAFDDNVIDLQFRAQDNRQLERVTLGVVHDASGTEIIPFREANICGSAIYGACDNPHEQSQDVALDPHLEGSYTAAVEACDTGGLCSQNAISFVLGLPVDLWVMGMEYNQAVQDFIFTDLDRAAGEAGLITFAESGFGMPVIPGKPLAVRVYIGVRQGPGSLSAPAEGFAATGELEVTLGDGTAQVLAPVDNPACSEQSGATTGQACLGTIQIHPSLGRGVTRQDPAIITNTGPLLVDLELPTRTDYDLDLIDQRARLEGTLNFVLPPDLTAAAAGRFTLRARVEPVGRAEAAAGDNEFELQLGEFTQPNPLDLGLVRVTVTANAAPASVASQDLLTEMLELTPYDALALNFNRTFFYDGDRLVIRLLLFGIFELAEETLTQCETLWLDLFDAFGLSNEYTLFAVSPAAVDLQGCGGLGWRVPGFGGIALSEIAANANDHEQLGTMAQEAYHAHLDRRHVSNDHEEADGCFLEEGILADLIDAAGFDTDCWKPAPYLHGSMGEYPLVGESIFGDRGTVGLEIEPDGPTWRLTLYDPCPTGGVDRSDELATLTWLGRRWDYDLGFADRRNPDLFNLGYLCREHANAPHDFMSYGDNPWTSVQQFLGETEVPAGLSRQPGGSAHALFEVIPQQSLSAWRAQGGLPGSQVTAIVTQTGAGFASLLPSPGGAAPVVGDASSPVMLTVEAEGETSQLPMAMSFAPGHPRSLIFLTTTLPSGVIPQRMAITFEGQELAVADASPHAPEVRVVTPNGGEELGPGEMMVVSWETSDADGDPLRLRVEYSLDAGTTWQTLGISREPSSISVAVDDLPPSPAALIRVVASDGIRLAEDTSDATFCVGITQGCAPLNVGAREPGRTVPLVLAAVLGGLLCLGGLVLVAILLRRRGRRPA